MILYHGSNIEVSKPHIEYSDFGRGFYTTPLYEQAVNWCRRFNRNGGIGTVSRYTLDDAAFGALKVLRFDSYSDEWLEFVLTCRRGRDSTAYDIVIGGVANDRVFNTAELYFDGLIDKAEAIKRLRFEKPNQQVCLRSERVLGEYLSFAGSENCMRANAVLLQKSMFACLSYSPLNSNCLWMMRWTSSPAQWSTNWSVKVYPICTAEAICISLKSFQWSIERRIHRIPDIYK